MTTSAAAGGQTILGCPVSSFMSLESACSATNVPACATASSIVYDAACCGSLSSYGFSLYSCYQQHAPTCLDTSALAASITGAATASNPCAAYATGAGQSSAGSMTSAAVMTSKGMAATATGTAATTSASGKSAAPKMGAGLKVYIGVALVGVLAVLSL